MNTLRTAKRKKLKSEHKVCQHYWLGLPSEIRGITKSGWTDEYKRIKNHPKN